MAGMNLLEVVLARAEPSAEEILERHDHVFVIDRSKLSSIAQPVWWRVRIFGHATTSSTGESRAPIPWSSVKVTILTRPEIGGEQPSYGPQLDDNEVAAVLTYIRKLLDGAAKRIMCEQVLKVRLDTARRPDYSAAWASGAPWWICQRACELTAQFRRFVLSAHGPGYRTPNTFADDEYKVPRTTLLGQVYGRFTPHSPRISADWLTHC
jgi:hypothetical protein